MKIKNRMNPHAASCFCNGIPAEGLRCMLHPAFSLSADFFHFHCQLNSQWQGQNSSKTTEHFFTTTSKHYFSLRYAITNHLTTNELTSATTVRNFNTKYCCDEMWLRRPMTGRQTMIFITVTLADWHRPAQNKQTISSSASSSCFGADNNIGYLKTSAHWRLYNIIQVHISLIFPHRSRGSFVLPVWRSSSLSVQAVPSQSKRFHFQQTEILF